MQPTRAASAIGAGLPPEATKLAGLLICLSLVACCLLLKADAEELRKLAAGWRPRTKNL